MKNILFIHQSAELYGSDKTLLMLLKKINRNNFFCIVILPNNGPLQIELEKLGIKVVIAPVLKLYRDIFSFKNIIRFIKDLFKAISILNKIHKEHKFDIVYSNTLAVLLGAVFAKKKKIKHIWHVHEIIEHPKSIAWLFPKLLYYFSNEIICNSKATKANIILREKKNSNKIKVVHNGIDFQKITNQLNKKDFGFSDEDVIITLVGRINRLKGHNWLLQTFNEYFKNQKNVKLLFVGSPVPNQEFYLHEIEEYIISNHLVEFVKIIPFTPNLNDIWSITDIAVMPSVEKESFGLVAVEAMMASIPVVATNHGGLTEIVTNEETGFLVEPNNKVALKEALEKLINNPELRNSFGKKGLNRAVENFSIENYVTKIEDILENN